MKHRSVLDGWQQLVRATAARGTVGVIVLALVTALACVIMGVSASVIYALVALLGATTALIGVTALLLTRVGRTEATGRAVPVCPLIDPPAVDGSPSRPNDEEVS
jgi:hypothetical protein